MEGKIELMYYKIFKISTTLIIALEVIFNSRLLSASTTIDYSSTCQYLDTLGKVRFTGTCKVNYGTLGIEGGIRFILAFPNGAEVIIYDDKEKASANNISADVAVAGGNIVVATEEGEIFIFKTDK